MGFCHHQRVDNRKVKHIIKSPYSTDQPERKVCACTIVNTYHLLLTSLTIYNHDQILEEKKKYIVIFRF